MKKLTVLLLLTTLMMGCANDSTDDLTVAPPTVITYEKDVRTIMNQSCATSGCHNAASNSAGLTLETYTQVRNAFETRGALNRMESATNSMPPQGNLPEPTLNIIRTWITNGYIEN